MSKNNITILGVGKLGICVALCLEKAGFNVIGLDISPSYVNSINNKTLQSYEPGVTKMLQSSSNFRATTNLDEALEFSDVILIYIATPSGPENNPYDCTGLEKLLLDINKRRVSNKHIVIGCTVLPEYTNKIGKFLLEDCVNTTLSYNPEFIAQGNIIYGVQHSDFVLIGSDSDVAIKVLTNIYQKLNGDDVIIKVMDPTSAEITKLAVNCFVTTKIAFANMIGDIADSAGADKNKILDAVGQDRRIGDKCIKAGYSYGGVCFPRDNRALGIYSNMCGIEPLIPRATDQSNKDHIKFQVGEILEELEDNEIYANHEPYYIEDVSFKDNCKVPIIEESAKLLIAKELVDAGLSVYIKDRPEVLNEVKIQYGDIFKYIIL